MKGKEFLDRINSLDNCIAAFVASREIKDGGKLALTDDQQAEILVFLMDYKKMLLENDIR